MLILRSKLLRLNLSQSNNQVGFDWCAFYQLVLQVSAEDLIAKREACQQSSLRCTVYYAIVRRTRLNASGEAHLAARIANQLPGPPP